VNNILLYFTRDLKTHDSQVSHDDTWTSTKQPLVTHFVVITKIYTNVTGFIVLSPMAFANCRPLLSCFSMSTFSLKLWMKYIPRLQHKNTRHRHSLSSIHLDNPYQHVINSHLLISTRVSNTLIDYWPASQVNNIFIRKSVI